MAYKDILLHLDNSPSCPARIELAISIARTHGAHVKGLFVVSHAYYNPRNVRGVTEAALKLEAHFTEKASQAGISFEWLYVDWSVIGVSITEIIDLYAYYSDLVIISQPDLGSQNVGTPADLPERLGLGSGRPLLVVPYSGVFSSAVERVMIAWKSGRESSRVVNDAMPFLEKARHVTIVTIHTSVSDSDSTERDVQRLCTYLSRHQVTAVHDQVQASSNFPLGDVLLNHACEQKMDLLAMGAFASTRRGNFVLGPVAKHLMSQMTLPVMISH